MYVLAFVGCIPTLPMKVYLVGVAYVFPYSKLVLVE